MTKRLIVLSSLLTSLAFAQEPAVDNKRTVFGSMSVDEMGHVCYMEPLGANELNRIEFRTDGKELLFLYQTAGDSSRQVEVTDLNSDGRPDLIHIEWMRPNGSTLKATYYRGDEYREHLRHHLLHALAATKRHLIKDRPEEKQRGTVIEARLRQLETKPIGPTEIGVYEENSAFRASIHKDLRYAFIAADTLHSALRSLVDGDVRVLSRPPEIVPTYRFDIDILFALDPSIDRRR